MRLRLFIPAFALLVFYSIPVWGGEFRLVPSLAVREEYNDNIFYTQDYRKHDLITTLSPGLEITDRTERLDADISARLDQLYYSDNHEVDATNNLFNGTATYRFSPLFSFSAQAGYAKFANPSLVTGTTGIVPVVTPWHHETASASSDYRLTEKATTVFSYNYSKDYYDNPRYFGDSSHEVNAGLIYDMGKYVRSVKGRMNAGYSHFSIPGFSRVDSVMVTAGFSRDIDEVWSILVEGGVQHVWSEFTVQQLLPSATIVINGETLPIAYHIADISVTNEGWGNIWKASLKYLGEQSSGDFSYTRDLSPAYGLNGAAERNAVTFSAHRRLTYELSADVSMGYYFLRSDPWQFSAQAINQHTSIVNATLRYDFSRDTVVEASYAYSRIDNLASDTSADRQAVSLRFSTQCPLFE
jgi:hypothetical protein